MPAKRMLAALTALCLILLLAPLTTATASSKYYITVDLTNQIVTVYDSENTDDSHIVRQMICSTGRPATPTPTGTFYLPSKSQSSERTEWYYFPKYKCYAKWATRIRGGILFHSTLFSAAKRGPTSASTRALGSKASHGCVRLRVDDAKFIAVNCTSGTKCRIFASGKTNNSLRNRLKKKTFNRDKQTYDSYMGRKPKESTLPLARNSTGTLVTQLQARLKALGFYAGNVNGTLTKTGIAAVKAFQAASGLKQTATVSQATWDAIFADNAATGTLVTLAQGSSGPAVTALQNNLVTLLMLDGDVDGTFGSQTAQAVKNYQNSFGYTATGSADTDLQEEIIARAASVRQTFGDSAYALDDVTVDAQMASVKVKAGARLRQTASKNGKSLKKLKYQTAMRVISDGKNWTRVRYGTRTGYVKRSALKFYTEPVTEKGYVQVAATPEPTAEPTPTPTPEPEPTVTPTPTPEIYIPTEADAMPEPAEHELPLEAIDDAVANKPEPEMTPEPTPEPDEFGLVFGTDPIEDIMETPAGEPDDGLAIDPEATPEPTPEPAEAIEAIEPEDIIFEVMED